MTQNTPDLDKQLYIKSILEQHGVYYNGELLAEFNDLDKAIEFRTKWATILQTTAKKAEENILEQFILEFYDLADGNTGEGLWDFYDKWHEKLDHLKAQSGEDR